MARALLAALLLVLTAVPAAEAATVSIEPRYDARSQRYDEIRFVAAAGERNVVTLGRSSTEGWIVEDAAAALTAGDGCQGGGARVTCRPLNRDFATVDLGDGDDGLLVDFDFPAASSVSAEGGPGSDTMHDRAGKQRGSRVLRGGDGNDVMSTAGDASLSGGAGDDRLTGSGRHDSLEAGPGADELRGGGGDDSLDPGTDSDADLVEGGRGSDLVGYPGDSENPRSLNLDLSSLRGPGGDVLRSIESAYGSNAGDRLTGTAARNVLMGSAGDDILRGRAGPDRLEGGEGRDRLEGGPGDDELLGAYHSDSLAGGAGNDRLDPGYGFEFDPVDNSVACGPGVDVLVLYRPQPVAVPADCERLELHGSLLLRMSARPALAGGAARWSLACSKLAHRGSGCRGRFELSAGGRELGSAPYRVAARSRRALRVPLNGAGRAFAARGGRLKVRVEHQGGSATYLVRVPALP